MKNKKFLFIIPSIDVTSAGPTYSLIAVMQRMIELKYDVELIHFDFFSNQRKPYSFERKFRLNLWKKLGISLSFFKYLLNEVNSEKEIIVYNNSQFFVHSLFIFFLKKFTKFKLIYSPRGSLMEVPLKSGRRVLKKIFLKPYLWLIQSSDYYFCTSEQESNQLGKLLPLEKKKIKIFPNTFEPPKSQQSLVKENIIIYLGRLIHLKGIHDLIKSWNLISSKNKGWNLYIIGPGKGDEYENMLKSLAYGNNSIRFIGEVDPSTRWTYLEKAKYLVLPSYSENFGNVVVEAMLKGTPPITTTDIPWGILKDKNIGFSCIRHNLASTLNKAMNYDEIAYNSLSIRTKEYAKKKYTPDSVIKILIEASKV